uniref:Secreted protein n=1 Tax=Rhipicephalus zambeziensis TaxID=60191 RepID=A0A224Y7Z8_9ACAR
MFTRASPARMRISASPLVHIFFLSVFSLSVSRQIFVAHCQTRPPRAAPVVVRSRRLEIRMPFSAAGKVVGAPRPPVWPLQYKPSLHCGIAVEATNSMQLVHRVLLKRAVESVSFRLAVARSCEKLNEMNRNPATTIHHADVLM